MPTRRRTRPTGTRRRLRRPLTAAAALGCGLALTACAAPHPGSAAVVDGDRITVSTVQNHVDRLRSAVGEETRTVNLDRFTVRQMITDRVEDRALADRHITVTPSAWHALKDRDTRRAGGAGQLRRALLKSGVLPGDIDAHYRRNARLDALVKASGTDPSDGRAAAEVINRTMAATAARMKVSVSPRYGTWNPRTAQLKPAAEPWLHPALSPQPQPA